MISKFHTGEPAVDLAPHSFGRGVVWCGDVKLRLKNFAAADRAFLLYSAVRSLCSI